MKRRQGASLSASLESLSEAVTTWTGSSTAFAAAAGVIVVS